MHKLAVVDNDAAWESPFPPPPTAIRDSGNGLIIPSVGRSGRSRDDREKKTPKQERDPFPDLRRGFK